MSENTRFWIGISLTIATNLAVFAYFQGGLNQNVNVLSSSLDDFKIEVKTDLGDFKSDLGDFKSDLGDVYMRVYSAKSSADANGLVLNRVDQKVDRIDDKVTDYGERIAKLEIIASGRGGSNAFN